MHSSLRVSLAFAAMSLIVFVAAPSPLRGQGKEQGHIVIIFKDGRQQSFRLADVARIEFRDTPVAASSVSSSRFAGRWKVGDGIGGTFYITLKPEGEAHKSMGNKDGTWTVVNGEARVTWNDGWKDIIRKSGRKYQKVAFGPGSSFDDAPSNTTEAEYTEPQ
jgi:hypothetical protein